jgi:hypothetical protein
VKPHLVRLFAACLTVALASGCSTEEDTALDGEVATSSDALSAGLIVLNKSIKGVEIEMTRRKVKALWGEPTSIAHHPTAIGDLIEFHYGKTTVFTNGLDKVYRVETRSPKMRTASDLGVGSTREEVHDKLRNETCATGSGCYSTDSTTGVSTHFFFDDGVVSSVALEEPSG